MRYVAMTGWILLVWAANARAHYHMLLPDKPSVKSGEEVVLLYQFGHPFEHQISDAAEPAGAFVRLPDGKWLDVKESLKKIQVAGENGKKVTAYHLSYKPEQRGDHIVVVTAPEVMLEGEKLPVQDTVKTVIHVQAEHGWDSHRAREKEQNVDLVPLTRPYGLRSGMLFRAVLFNWEPKKPRSNAPSPLAHAKVEVELYHAESPKELPPEEHRTYTSRTDEKGVLAATLPDAGWWSITAYHETDKAIHRCTWWVQVDGKIPLKPAE